MLDYKKQIIVNMEQEFETCLRFIEYKTRKELVWDYITDLIHIKLREEICNKIVFVRNEVFEDQAYCSNYCAISFKEALYRPNIKIRNFPKFLSCITKYVINISKLLQQDHIYDVGRDKTSLVVKDLGNIYKLRYLECLDIVDNIKNSEECPWDYNDMETN